MCAFLVSRRWLIKDHCLSRHNQRSLLLRAWAFVAAPNRVLGGKTLAEDASTVANIKTDATTQIQLFAVAWPTKYTPPRRSPRLVLLPQRQAIVDQSLPSAHKLLSHSVPRLHRPRVITLHTAASVAHQIVVLHLPPARPSYGMGT